MCVCVCQQTGGEEGIQKIYAVHRGRKDSCNSKAKGQHKGIELSFTLQYMMSLLKVNEENKTRPHQLYVKVCVCVCLYSCACLALSPSFSGLN